MIKHLFSILGCYLLALFINYSLIGIANGTFIYSEWVRPSGVFIFVGTLFLTWVIWLVHGGASEQIHTCLSYK